MTSREDTAGEPLLQVSGLNVTANVDGRERAIVSGIDLRLDAGETICIVGESGSGKSMTVRALMGLLRRGVTATGSIRYQGRELLPGPRNRRLHPDFGMILQDPFTMLNPAMTAGRHVTETLRDPRGRRLRRAAERDAQVGRLAEVGIHDPSVARRYPFELSGGMRQRIGIAAALASGAQVLFADEPTTALDVTTQAEILALLKQIQRARGMAMVLITHDLSIAFSMCDRLYVMYAGQIVEHAPAAALAAQPWHPYSNGLLASDPPTDHRAASLFSMPGSVPRAADVLTRCPFADRCAWTTDDCRTGPTPLATVGEGRQSACVRIDDIRAELTRERQSVVLAAQPVAPPAEAAVLRVRDLRMEFARAGQRTTALDGVSIEVAAGECVGVVGESGSGKTTLGRCVVGLEQATGGHITIGDVDASRFDSLSRQELSAVRATVQMAFQDPYSTLSPARSIGAAIREAVLLDGRPHPDPAADIAELLRLVGLPAELAGRKPSALSGGERQRVALARALARRPDLIICDEIVSALDVSVQAQILNLLARLRRELGVALLFITHDLAVVRQITDRVYVLRRGQLVESGATDAVLDNPRHEYTRKLIASVLNHDRQLPTSATALAVASRPARKETGI
jgi:peptide/nickel transport system ATP-binding protein